MVGERNGLKTHAILDCHLTSVRQKKPGTGQGKQGLPLECLFAPHFTAPHSSGSALNCDGPSAAIRGGFIVIDSRGRGREMAKIYIHT